MTRPNVNVVVGGPVGNEAPSKYKIKYVRSNLPFEDQVTDTDTKYVIRWDFDLNGETVTLPDGCVLEFDGGSLDNGSLVGETEIYNAPDDLLEKVNCGNLYVSNFPHLTKADVFEFFDTFKKDSVIDVQYAQHVLTAAKYYSVDNIKHLFYVPYGTESPNIQFLFYDKDFVYTGTSGTFRKDYRYEIPTGTSYVRFTLGFPRTTVGRMDEIRSKLFINLLFHEGVLVQDNELRNSEDLEISKYTSTAYINRSEMYYHYPDTNIQSVCLSYSVFKDYKYLEVVPNRIDATRVHFLKEEPTISGTKVKYSAWYPYYVDLKTIDLIQKRIVLPIPSDVRFIAILSGNDQTQAMPEKMVLHKENSLDFYNTELNDAVKASQRNMNILSHKFIHWNVGRFVGGAWVPALDENDYVQKRNEFNAFFNKYNCHILFNEYAETFAIVNDSEVLARSVLDTKKKTYVEFPPSVFALELASYQRDGLIGYNYRPLASTKGMIYHAGGSSSDKRPFYSVGIVIYSYSLGNTTINVIHVHVPANRTSDERALIFNEILAISRYYGNVIIAGDLNTTTAESLAVFTSAGFTILNDTTPTHGDDIIDWVLYKVGSGITVNGFSVLTDAVDGDGNQLSDHMPVTFTVSTAKNDNIPVHQKGSYKFDAELGVPVFSDGDKWLNFSEGYSPVGITGSTTGKDLNNIKKFGYYAVHVTDNTFSNIPPSIGTEGFIMKVGQIGIQGGNSVPLYQILFSRTNGIFYRMSSNAGSFSGKPWMKISAVEDV